MGAYQYQALRKNGASCKGIIEADSERQARQFLREQDLIPTLVTTLKKPALFKQNDKIKTQDLALLTRQLATLLTAGIPVEEALSGVSEQTEKEKVRKIIIAVRAKVREGFSLAQALAEYPKVFQELYRATIAAGEHTGKLDVVLEKLADYTEKQQAIKQKIKQAFIYPSLMIIVSVSIVSFLLIFVVPKIIEVFANTEQTLPQMTIVLIFLSSSLKKYGIYILASLLIFIILFTRSLANNNIKTKWHQFLLKLPMIAYLVKTINVSRYIHTFGILFAAGVNVLETMKVSADLVNNLIIREAFNNASNKVREGTAIHKSLQETTFLNPMTIHLIGSGEKSGQVAFMMEQSAKYLDSELQRLIDTGLTLLEPMIILFMGSVVLFIVLATLLPIFTMQQLIN